MIIARDNGVRSNASSLSFKSSGVPSKLEGRLLTSTHVVTTLGTTQSSQSTFSNEPTPSANDTSSASTPSRRSSISQSTVSPSLTSGTSLGNTLISSTSSSSSVRRPPPHPNYDRTSLLSNSTSPAMSTVSDSRTTSDSVTSSGASPTALSQVSSISAKTNHNRIIIGSSVGAACLIFLVLVMLFLFRARRKSVISLNETDTGKLKDSDGPTTESASYHATHGEKLQTYATNDEDIALPFPYSQPNYASEISLSQYSTTSSPAPSIFEAVASPEIIGPIYPSRSPDPNPFHADDASSVDIAFDNEPLFLHGADPNRFKATSPTPEGNLSRSSTVKSTGGRSSLRSRITLGVAM